MDNWAFFAAAGLAALWLVIHLFAGGRDTARPLLDCTELSPVVRDTLYICWHFVTASLALMAGLFVWAGLSGQNAPALAATALAASFSFVGIGLALRQRANLLEVPQGWLFVPVAGLGCAGLL